jgi:MerR family copper efflux transcriptional regulator
MNIGQAAKASGISAKMIRHYEAIGLIPKAARGTSGYRNYQPADVQLLRFASRARAVGFATSEIRQLLSLWQDRQRPAREVRRLAQNHLTDLQSRIEELKVIAVSLSHLIDHCRGDERPECPILDALADGRADTSKQGATQRDASRRKPPQRSVAIASGKSGSGAGSKRVCDSP